MSVPTSAIARIFDRKAWGLALAVLLLLGICTLPGQARAASCDLEITSQTGVPLGSVTNMTFTFCNRGPETCSGTSVRMPVNFPGTTLSTFTARNYDVTDVVFGSGWTSGFPPVGNCTFANDQVVCENIRMTAGTCANIEIFGTPIPNPTNEGCISAYWAPGANNVDPDTDDNPHQSCYPIGVTNVITSKNVSGGTNPIIQGREVVFTVSVINQAAIPLDVAFIDEAPSSLEFLRVENGPGITCTSVVYPGGSPRVACERAGGWPASTTTTFQLVFRAASAGTFTNTCSMGTLPTGWTADNSDCNASFTIRTPGDVVKTGPNTPLPIGSEFDWTIDATFYGSQVTTYVVEDTIPSGFDILGVTFEPEFPNSCDVVGQTVTCTFNILPGNNCAVSPCHGAVTIRVRANMAGTFTNMCTATYEGILFENGTACRHTVTIEDDPEEADIEVIKTADTPIFWPGQPISYTISVTNHGPDTAWDVEVLDSLPFTSGTWTVSAPLSASCSSITPTSSHVTCWYGLLTPGETRHITLSGVVPANYPDPTLLNRCSAYKRAGSSHTWVDPNGNNNDFSHCRVELPVGTPNLSVAKTAAGTAPLGGEFEYTLTVQNGAPVTVPNVQVVDTLPAGVVFVSANASAHFTCAHASGVVTCSAPSLPANAVAQITIRVRAEAPGSVTNTCTATTGNGTVDTSGCSTTTTIVPGTVTVSKSDDKDPVWLEESFFYLLRIENASGARADNVVVTDTLPSGLVFHSVGQVAPFTCSHAAGTVTCSADQVPAGTSVTIPIEVHGTQPGTVTNTCTATVGGNPVPGACSETTTIQNGTVDAVKSDSQDPVALGQPFNYHIAITNTSQGKARDVLVTDMLPSALKYISHVDPDAFSCTFDDVLRLMTCQAAELPVGYSGTLTITVIPRQAGTILNTCEVRVGNATMSTPGCTEFTEVERVAFDVVKTDSHDPVQVGDHFSYYLDWSYEEDFALATAIIDDVLPSTLTVISINSDSPNVQCNTDPSNANRIGCRLTDVQPHTSGRIEIVVQAPDYAEHVLNVCSVTVLDHHDYDVSDCNEPTLVLPKLDIRKSDDVDPVRTGDVIRYRIDVENTHNAPVDAVEIADTLPANATFEAVTAPIGWDCDETNVPDWVSCMGTVPANDTVTIEIDLRAPDQEDLVHNECVAYVWMETLADEGDSTRDPSVVRVDLPAPECIEDTTVVAPRADLVAIKRGPATPVAPGHAIDYVIEVTNNGPDAAENAVVSDSLPQGTSFVSATGAGWTCSHDGGVPGVVTCSAPQLEVGQAPDIVVRVQAPMAPGAIVNTCTIGSDTPDPVANPECSATTVIRELDPIVAMKTDSVDPVLAGGVIQYTISVTNTDADVVASDVTVVDTLPAGTTFVAASGNGWTCGHDGNSPGQVTCQTDAIAPGDTSAILMQVQAPAEPGSVVNTCTASVGGVPAWPADLTGCSEDTTIRGAEALVVSKVDTVDPVFAGQPVTYRITVTNTDPEVTADNVVVIDTLPPGTQFQAVNSAAGSCAHSGGVPGQVSCSLGSLAPGTSNTIEVVVTAPDDPGTITNTCTATAEFPGNVDDTACREDTAVVRAGDLIVTKEDLADPVQAGQLLTYRLSVYNSDPDVDATDVVVTDTLPGGTVFQSASTGGGSCSHDGGEPGVVTCMLPTVPARQTVTIDIIVQAPLSAGTVTNTCSATATFNGNVNDTACREDTTITSSGALVVTKTDAVDPVEVGEPIAYTIRVANTSAGDEATDVVVTDPLPAGTRFVSVEAPGASCTHDGGEPGVVTCTFGAIAPDSVGTINLVVEAPQAAGQVTNVCTASATFAGSVDDSGCSENTRVIEPDTPEPEIQMSKTASPAFVRLGDVVTWTISVANTGAGDAEAVVVKDDVPAALAVDTATASQGVCVILDQQVRCDLGDLAAGSSATVTVTTRAVAEGSTENVCVVNTPSLPTLSSSRCAGTVVVGDRPDIQVAKYSSQPVVTPGEAFTWTIQVSNTGTGDAQDLTVTDAMPAGIEVIQTPASCAYDRADLVCQVGTLAAGATTSLVFEVRAPAPGQYTNVCVVSFANEDSDTDDVSNGCASQVTVAVPGGRPSGTRPVPVNDPKALLLMVLMMIGLAAFVMRR